MDLMVCVIKIIFGIEISINNLVTNGKNIKKEVQINTDKKRKRQQRNKHNIKNKKKRIRMKYDKNRYDNNIATCMCKCTEE